MSNWIPKNVPMKPPMAKPTSRPAGPLIIVPIAPNIWFFKKATNPECKVYLRKTVRRSRQFYRRHIRPSIRPICPQLPAKYASENFVAVNNRDGNSKPREWCQSRIIQRRQHLDRIAKPIASCWQCSGIGEIRRESKFWENSPKCAVWTQIRVEHFDRKNMV